MAQGEVRRGSSPRTWGYWTEQKLSMLAEYLSRFTVASTKSPRTLYLDLFAGKAKNASRLTGDEIEGSARVALNTEPRFTKAILFELPEKAPHLEAELRKAYTSRDFDVVAGNCNDELGRVLARLKAEDWDRAPTFAFVDQQAAEIQWQALQRLASFRQPPRSKWKVEIWLLFAPSMLPRGLASVDPDAAKRFDTRITAMYGTGEWRHIDVARRRGLLNGPGSRDELLNLMRWRLENELGYKVTHSFEMKNTHGVPIYDMVFATDHDAGERIMKHIYGNAAKKRPSMQAEAERLLREKKEDETGVLALIPPLVRPAVEELYEHQPPTPPYRLPDGEEPPV